MSDPLVRVPVRRRQTANKGDRPEPLDAETRAAIRLLQAAADKCKRMILHPIGASDPARFFEASRAAQKLKGIERELAAVNAKLNGVAGKKISAAWAKGVADAEKMAVDAGIAGHAGSPSTGSFNLIDSARAKILLRDTTGDLTKAVKSIGDNTRRIVRQTQALRIDDRKLNQILAGGTLDGTPAATLQEFKKAVRTAAIDGKIITVNTRTGATMSFEPDYYAEMVFQTKQAEATNVATLERLQSRKMFYVKIIGSHSANFCTAFVDKVFYTGPGEDPLGLFPHIRTLPRGGAPFHPRCTKRYVAFIPHLASAEEIEKAKLSDEQRTLLNKDGSSAQKRYEEINKRPVPQPAVDYAEQVSRQAADARRQLRETDLGFEATGARLGAEHVKVSDELDAAIARGDRQAFQDSNDRLSQIAQEKLANEAARRKSGSTILAAENPIRADYVLDSALGPNRKQLAVDGIEHFTRMVDRAVAPKISVIARPLDSSLGIYDRSYYYKGKVHVYHGSDVGVMVHEIAHQLEEMVPGLHDAALAFLDRRTAGETAVTLRKLTGNMNYRVYERAWPDDFFSPYCGKDYNRRATEILSMGIESLFRDPFFLAKTDPDYFEFLFKAFRGVFK